MPNLYLCKRETPGFGRVSVRVVPYSLTKRVRIKIVAKHNKGSQEDSQVFKTPMKVFKYYINYTKKGQSRHLISSRSLVI
jgi:hypothetical protein